MKKLLRQEGSDKERSLEISVLANLTIFILNTFFI